MRTSLAALALSAAALAAPALAEDWIGQVTVGGKAIVFDAACRGEPTCAVRPHVLGGGPGGYWRRTGAARVSELRLGSDTLHLAATTVSPTRLAGSVEGVPGARFELGALAERSEARGLEGLYRSADGHWLGVGTFDEFGEGDFLFDYATGRIGPVIARATGEIEVGASVMAPLFPAAGQLTRRGGDLVQEGRAYAPTPLARTPFTVPVAGAALKGEVTRLRGRPPRGLVLIVHGSGPGPRSLYELWKDWFVSQGWAVAVFDKRGSGASSGDWRSASLQGEAQDARTVLRRVRALPFVKGRPVGLWAISQGGWVAPQVAATEPVDFVILHGAPATTPLALAADSAAAEMTAYGFSPDEVAIGRRYYALDAAVSAGRQPWREIEAAYKEATARKVEWILAPPEPDNSADRRFFRLVADFDPAPDWRRVRAPVLALYGGKDNIVPAEPNARLLRTLIGSSPANRIVVLPDDNHLGMIAQTGVRTEYGGLGRLDTGYFQAVATWLKPRAHRARAPTPRRSAPWPARGP